MPNPDTFAEVVRWLEKDAARCEPDGECRPMLLKAARLLAAAGEEVRAGRTRLNPNGHPYINADAMQREAYRKARAATDALAHELKETDHEG